MENFETQRLRSIGDKIKKLRVEAGYTSYAKFAIAIDMGRKQYWRLEKGYNFTMNSLFRILDAHKMTLREFFKDLEM